MILDSGTYNCIALKTVKMLCQSRWYKLLGGLSIRAPLSYTPSQDTLVWIVSGDHGEITRGLPFTYDMQLFVVIYMCWW